MPVAQGSNALRHEEAKPGRRTVRVGSQFLVHSVAPGLKPPSLPGGTTRLLFRRTMKTAHVGAYAESPLGRILLAARGDRLSGLWFCGQKYFGGTDFGGTAEGEFEINPDWPVLAAARAWLAAYFAGKKPAIPALPLAPEGSGFRQAVWQLLCEIPYGTVTSYGAIARQLAARLQRPRMSAQAVGGAVGHNPIAIIIPCHRVVGATGSLTGYAGGIATKIGLLKLEGVDCSRLFVPKQGTAL